MKRLWPLALLLMAEPATASDAPHWQVEKAKSSLTWTALYSGKAIDGAFPDFSADIQLDPENTASAHVQATIKTATVKSADKDAQTNLALPEWLGAAQFPEAVFIADRFRAKDKGDYEAVGSLRLHGHDVPLIVPFKLTFKGALGGRVASMAGNVTLKRLAFGVGSGDWASPDQVADDVTVHIRIQAKEVP